jgi:hypothetical protein
MRPRGIPCCRATPLRELKWRSPTGGSAGLCRSGKLKQDARGKAFNLTKRSRGGRAFLVLLLFSHTLVTTRLIFLFEGNKVKCR